MREWLSNGKLFNKKPTDRDYVGNQFKKPMQSLSLHGDILNIRADRQRSNILNILAKNGAIVNPSLPSISTIES